MKDNCPADFIDFNCFKKRETSSLVAKPFCLCKCKQNKRYSLSLNPVVYFYHFIGYMDEGSVLHSYFSFS